jgi:hypothetical protein
MMLSRRLRNSASPWKSARKRATGWRKKATTGQWGHVQWDASFRTQGDAFLIQLNLQLDDKLVDNLMDHRGGEVIEPDDDAGVRETERKSIGLIQQDNSPDAMDEIKKIFTPENQMMLSRRLRNSGVKIFLISSIASGLLSCWIRPM